MRGRELFMEALLAHGVERIFGNPGTTESPLLDSLSAYPSIRYVTALHEGVALCAASYYAQASGKTGVVSLHVAPGLGNAIGMLYGALRANSPMVVTAGGQDTRLRLNNPVLGHDLVAMAAPVTKWSVQVERADEMAPVLRRAFKIAHDEPKGPVFVALPIDVMEQETEIADIRPAITHRPPRIAPQTIEAIAEVLVRSQAPALLLGDDAARASVTSDLVRLAESLGASVWHEGLRMRTAFPTDHFSHRLSLPFDAGQTRDALAAFDTILVIGGRFFEDVWFAPGSPFPDEATVLQIETSYEHLGRSFAPEIGAVGDIADAIPELVAAINAAPSSFHDAARQRCAALQARKAKEGEVQRTRTERAWDRRPISIPRAMAEIAEGLPADAIVVDESITASIDLARTIVSKGPDDYFGARGGGIGQGLAGALGVKAAEPARPVLCISGDGSAMYSIQALWTAAHAGLPVVFVILANGEYRILKHNIDVYRQRFQVTSQEPYAHMELHEPRLGFVEMANGMGIAATRIEDPATIAGTLSDACQSGLPHLIEIAIEAKR